MAVPATIKALHASLKDDPMALIMGPAIQAGLSLAARLEQSDPEFWQQFASDLLAVGAEVDGLETAEVEVMNDILTRYKGTNDATD